MIGMERPRIWADGIWPSASNVARWSLYRQPPREFRVPTTETSASPTFMQIVVEIVGVQRPSAKMQFRRGLGLSTDIFDTRSVEVSRPGAGSSFRRLSLL
jgi:hypothetical protein